MTDSIFELANRANLACANRLGFVRCAVESERPRTLAFDFSSGGEAEAFMFEQRVQGVQMRMEIASDRPDTALQYR